ncbi:MAG: endonuclease/exonuclease/phosphatase family protein [Burkholderiaceae bacterium]
MEIPIASAGHSLLLRVAKCFVAMVAGATIALSAAFVLQAQAWWIELARYAPYPVYLLAAGLALLTSLWLKWAWRAAVLLALALVASVIMGFVWGNPDKGSQRLRVMTYNIKSYLADERPESYSRIAWEVLENDPDILVLQDAQRLIDAKGAMPEPVRKMLDGRTVHVYGQYVVASRYTMRDCGPGKISFRGRTHTFVRCVVTAHSVDIDLFTAHFLSPREGLNATRYEGAAGLDDWQQNFEDRMTQARALAEVVASSRRPVIVAGDLNAPEGSPVVGALLDAGLRDAFSSAARGFGYTHGHALRPGISFLRIDHILVSPTLGVLDCFVGSKDGSEHRPVVADLLLKRE